jgi:hypothetical protein
MRKINDVVHITISRPSEQIIDCAVSKASSTVSEVPSAALVAHFARRDISVDVQQLTPNAFKIHTASCHWRPTGAPI